MDWASPLQVDDPAPGPHDEVDRRSTTPPTSLQASISPPPSRVERTRTKSQRASCTQQNEAPLLNFAAVEAGRAQITNHLDYFSTQLSPLVRQMPSNGSRIPPLSIAGWKNLYKRNQQPQGRHWVIHQHDHPVAGLHYDLRLQISETSSISWAIMYGLPGSVNSRRLNRNATETRVHNLWNHLIETASNSTGSLLIWDTGEYEVLPWQDKKGRETEDELSDFSGGDVDQTSKLSDSEKLHLAFQNRRIRIRLHGTRLPKDYTLSIRLLTTENRFAQPAKPSRKRRRKSAALASQVQVTPPTSDLDEDEIVPDAHPIGMPPSASALECEIAEQEDEEVRQTNAYPGATNSIGSIHQRRWFLSMDRYSSGFRPMPLDNAGKGGRRKWTRRREDGRLLGFEPFHVLGREVERSVLTGRSADEVMNDEGVEGFVGRKGWRAVMD